MTSSRSRTTHSDSQTQHGLQGTHLDRAFLQARENCWVPIENRRVFIGCGDDRPLTIESAEALYHAAKASSPVLNPAEGYASIYGGVTGQAKNVLVVGVAQFGSDFIANVGGFDGIMGLLIQNSRNLQTIHSAAGNENDQRHFLMHGDAPVGCAYAAGVGATSDLLVNSDSAIPEIARLDQSYVFGSDHGFNKLLHGHQAFLEHATAGKGSQFAFGRPSYKAYLERYGNALHLMILAGSHVGARRSGVVSNFSLSEVGSTKVAHEHSLDFYHLDIAVITDTVLQALDTLLRAINKEYVLDPELLMRAFQMDSVPVRAVLSANDSEPALSGKLDPRGLAMGFRDNPFSAIEALRQRQASGFYSS